MNQLPTAQEFLEYRTPRGIDNVYPDYWEAMIDFAKLHVDAALKKQLKKHITEILVVTSEEAMKIETQS